MKRKLDLILLNVNLILGLFGRILSFWKKVKGLGLAVDIFDLNGDKIRELREALGWSREHLSEKSGIAPRTIQNIETMGTENPGIETLKVLLAVMVKKEEDPAKKALIALIPRLDSDQVDILHRTTKRFLGITSDTDDVLSRARALVNSTSYKGKRGAGNG